MFRKDYSVGFLSLVDYEFRKWHIYYFCTSYQNLTKPWELEMYLRWSLPSMYRALGLSSAFPKTMPIIAIFRRLGQKDLEVRIELG